MIKNVRMNWETENHTFTLETGGDRLSTLDFLKDFMGSVEDLYNKIVQEYDYEQALPRQFKVHGGCTHTHIEGVV